MGSLTGLAIKSALKAPGRYGDGDGLFLEVSGKRAASWIVRVQKNGRRRDFGLGALSKVPLAMARERARQIRMQVEAGLDPVIERRKSAGMPTFRQAAAEVHAEHKRSWRNGKHQAQWINTLTTYAFPQIGEVAIDKVEIGHVRDILSPIWIDKAETARRVRQRIGTILDYAVAKNWRDHSIDMRAVSKGLPRQPKKEGHFEAMPYVNVPAYLENLRTQVSVSRLALEVAILTAVRSGELRKATWGEIDWEEAIWTITPENAKGGKQYKVPLSDAAVDAFKRAWDLRTGDTDLVFPGQKRGKPISDMTMIKLLRSSGLKCTVHGFRSAFRDWAAEEAGVPGEVAEAALAHKNRNKVEAAYLRTDFFAKRRSLMKDWGEFLNG